MTYSAFTQRVLGVPLTVVAAASCLLLLLTWVPHYLTWPWWVDTDQFATSALSWRMGVLPYRDLPDFDFPGPIFLLSALGYLFGWGRTAPFYAVDALFLIVLGVALALWSRRLFGGVLPGLLGYLPFVCFYLSLDYALVAQRDWQSPFFVVLGLLSLQAARGRAGRLASTLAVAVGFSIRPQIVLFLPALMLAVCDRPVIGDPRRGRALLSLFEWLIALGAATGIVFSPLILAGVMGDFLRLLSTARYGGSYNQATYFSVIHALNMELWDPRTAWGLAASIALSTAGPPPLRGYSRAWTLAMIGALLYKPLSPVPHAYLDQPLVLIRSVNLALPAAWLLSTTSLSSTPRLLALCALLAVGAPRAPLYCSASRSARAVGSLVRGADPVLAPLGCERRIPNGSGLGDHYRWGDYCRLLNHLRRSTPPTTRVANFLRVIPYPAVNGPSGRLSPFPAAGGIMHLSLVDPALEDQFIASLVEDADAIVVWALDETSIDSRVEFPRLAETIRRHYQVEARFGIIEVWRNVHSSR